jgi:hypothetical protein
VNIECAMTRVVQDMGVIATIQTGVLSLDGRRQTRTQEIRRDWVGGIGQPCIGITACGTRYVLGGMK